MESLPASRLAKVLRATAQAVEFRDLSEFRAGAIALVRELVPCESASYNEVKPGTGAIVVADPAGWLTAESLEVFGRLAGENPLIAHYGRTGDGQPVRFSDFLSRRCLHRLALYEDLYREMEVEHQIAFVLPSPPGEVVGIALNRTRHDFTGDEAAMLDLLRRPLRACYERLVERERLMGLLASYEGREDVAARMTALGLSEREVEVMLGVIGGASNTEVGIGLQISRRTVEKHLQNVYAQLDVTSRTQAIERVR
ncbi:MAG TPA: helix-turn-helix transcriptional regulator [Solirubrobacteraceae bacterium]|jgi:DNA-binding CsgD family transcriptional regulator